MIISPLVYFIQISTLEDGAFQQPHDIVTTTSMKWKPPNIASPQLYLPQLQKCSPQEWSPIQCVQPVIDTPVSTAFIEAWVKGPENNQDPGELNQLLFIIGQGFSQLIQSGQSKVSVREKTSPADLVTDMDQGIEMLFRLWIHTHYPHHKIVGEEGGKDTFTYDNITWFIDPIDGTHNFVQGYPNVTIHLGAIKQGMPYACYVGKPFFNQHYRLGDAPEKRPSATLTIGSEFLPTRHSESTLFTTLCTQLNATPHRVMSIGINLLDIWQEKVSLFYKPRLKPWDGLAPLLLIHASQSLLVTQYYPCHAKSISQRHSPIFPLSPDTITEWSHLCQNNCRVGHFILATPHAAHLVDQVAKDMFNHV